MTLLPAPLQRAREPKQNTEVASSAELLPINNNLLQEYLKREGYDAYIMSYSADPDAQGVFTRLPLEKEVGFEPSFWLIPSQNSGWFHAITIVKSDIPKS